MSEKITDNGYIKLYRDLLFNGHFNMPPNAFKIFIYCLIKANVFEKNAKKKNCTVGQFWSSYPKIIEDCSSAGKTMSRGTVSSAMKYLVKNDYIINDTDSGIATLITVVNFRKYQEGIRETNDDSSSKIELPKTQDNIENKIGSSIFELPGPEIAGDVDSSTITSTVGSTIFEHRKEYRTDKKITIMSEENVDVNDETSSTTINPFALFEDEDISYLKESTPIIKEELSSNGFLNFSANQSAVLEKQEILETQSLDCNKNKKANWKENELISYFKASYIKRNSLEYQMSQKEKGIFIKNLKSILKTINAQSTAHAVDGDLKTCKELMDTFFGQTLRGNFSLYEFTKKDVQNKLILQSRKSNSEVDNIINSMI